MSDRILIAFINLEPQSRDESESEQNTHTHDENRLSCSFNKYAHKNKTVKVNIRSERPLLAYTNKCIYFICALSYHSQLTIITIIFFFTTNSIRFSRGVYGKKKTTNENRKRTGRGRTRYDTIFITYTFDAKMSDARKCVTLVDEQAKKKLIQRQYIKVDSYCKIHHKR